MPKRKAASKLSDEPGSKKRSKQKTAKSQKSKETKKKVAEPKKTPTKKAAAKIVTKVVSKKKMANKSAHTPAQVKGLQDLLREPKWKAALSPLFDKPYFHEIQKNLAAEYALNKEVFPPKDLIFNAFELTPFDKVKVVILGQDPYYDNGQAMGLSFSVPVGIAIPSSLRNIYDELERDPKIKGFKRPDHGCLEKWADQGVLMINATLTVEAHKPNSHAKFGWQEFTDDVIRTISEQCPGVVFILWGNIAQKKAALIDSSKHEIIKTAHPSPWSIKHFRACNCFSDCDAALVKLKHSPLNWSLS